MTCIIVGGGSAGFQSAMTCRTLWPDKAVTVIDAEKEVGYYRTLLPHFMAGELTEDKLFFPHKKDDPLFSVRSGVRAKKLDRNNRSLLLSNGEVLTYDRLILAHGGLPYLPDIISAKSCQGVFPVRDLTAARASRAWLIDHRRVIIVGGSLVGVKTAVHLCQAGFEVSLLVRRDHVLLRALSQESAGVVEEHLRRIGIRIYFHADLEDIRAEQGSIDAVKAGGQWLSCNTLLVAAGTAPDTSFLEGTGIVMNGRIVVSPALQTADPRIFAAGDVAVIDWGGNHISPNTWPQAVSQGRLAASNLYRVPPVPQTAVSRVNVIDLHGLAMVVLGPPVAGAEVISYTKPEAGVRRELFLTEGKPVGGALIGDITAAGRLHALINSNRAISPEEAALLRPGSRKIIRFQKNGGRRQALILTPKRGSL
jgi:nitrite reductase (NADH) large subunit